MKIPVSDELTTSRGLLDIRMEETMSLAFNLSDQGQYVDTGAIKGRILVDFELNRPALIDRLDRLDSPSITDRINMFLEDWSLDDTETEKVQLNYGQLLFKAAEPMGIDPTITLGGSFDVETLRSTSPENLTQELRTEKSYETTYDDLSDQVSEYLEREGVVADPRFSAPIHIQAKANPAVRGTDFTITIENNEYSRIHTITVGIDMPAKVGREVTLGHGEDGSPADGITGSYDPERQMFSIDVDGLGSASDSDSAERDIRFHVPGRAQDTLDELVGTAEFTRDQPFSSLIPVAVYDAGGHRVGGEEVSVNASGHVEAQFEANTAEIAVGSTGKVQKNFRVEGVIPTQAVTEIEEVLQDRGVSDAKTEDPEPSRDMREGTEVTRFSGGIREGRVLVGNTRVEINIDIKGERRTANRETARETDENLPAERRSIAEEYGWTGVTVNAEGADQEVVDEYVSGLRDELQVRLESLSEAM